VIWSGAGPIEPHIYVWVDPGAVGVLEPIRGAWFGLVSLPGRTFGCHVLLENGAVYRNIPLHMLSHGEAPEWHTHEAQTWDCYGTDFALVAYPFLKRARCHVKLRDGSKLQGEYLFTIVPMNDGWSESPDQAKEFFVIALDNGRFTAQPTNHVLVQDLSFVDPGGQWPVLKRQDKKYSVDD